MFTTIKVYACYAVKIYKQTQKYFQTGGWALGEPVLDPPLIFASYVSDSLILIIANRGFESASFNPWVTDDAHSHLPVIVNFVYTPTQ